MVQKHTVQCTARNVANYAPGTGIKRDVQRQKKKLVDDGTNRVNLYRSLVIKLNSIILTDLAGIKGVFIMLNYNIVQDLK